MPKPATKSATDALMESVVTETKAAFTGAGHSNAGSRVHTEDTPYDFFPHGIVLFTDEGRSIETEDKGSAPVVDFPQVNFYDKGSTGWQTVADLANRYIQRVTAPNFSVSGWTVRFNRLVFNQRNSTSVADEATVYSRSVQVEVHLESM